VRVDGDHLRCAACGKDFNAKDAQKPTFDSSITCPICGAAIPAVKMDLRFIARYTCANCKSNVLIEGEKSQA
jgi:DNA-directed RNA polymerase subunit RPC12/RpoP